MSGCGVGCVIFIWASFLWPIIVSIAFLLFKSKIIKKGKYFLVNSLVGYGIFICVNILIIILTRTFIDIEKLTENGVNIEMLANSIFWVGILVLYFPPIVSSHLLAKRFS
jgi:hypothetical protein